MNPEFAELSPYESSSTTTPQPGFLAILRSRSCYELAFLAWLILLAFYVVSAGLFIFAEGGAFNYIAQSTCLLLRLGLDYFGVYVCLLIFMRRNIVCAIIAACPAIFFSYMSIFDLQLYPKLIKVATEIL